jgi:hypothetical protein
MRIERSLRFATAALAAGGVVSATSFAGDYYRDRDYEFRFEPINVSASSADWNPAAPRKLPRGFEQRVVSNETNLNIYDSGRDDWHDMNTVNETGWAVGRYLYRTHEVRGQVEGGAVSVVDLKTGATKLLAQDPSWDALDGNRWTPWGTVLFAEEVEGGRLFEIELDPYDLTTALAVHDRMAVGRPAHEGIEVGPDGAVYVVDELRGQSQGCSGVTPCGGGIYKFVPTVYGDLSSGSLYALKVSGPDGVGQGQWVGSIDAMTARQSGTDFGGTSYQRPEDVEIIGDVLYVAITEGPRAQGVCSEVYEGRVIAVDLDTLEVTNFVKPGVNVPVEIGHPGDADFQTGFDSIDNLAESPDGRLVIIEDNVPSDIWFASRRTNRYGASRKVELFASLTDPEAEGTGIYFSPEDPRTLYVNVQHSAADDGDGTWAIKRRCDYYDCDHH